MVELEVEVARLKGEAMPTEARSDVATVRERIMSLLVEE
jgi:hypothetical protein